MSMYGLGMSMSKNSLTRSSSTAGAKGRNDSRYLILRLIRDWLAGSRGSPRMLRAPRARGPNSIRPVTEADDVAGGQPARHLAGSRSSGDLGVRRPDRVEVPDDGRSSNAGPR